MTHFSAVRAHFIWRFQMHGSKSNKHDSTLKFNTDFELSHVRISKGDKGSKHQESSVYPLKPTYVYSMADVEKQILDWQEDTYK